MKVDQASQVRFINNPFIAAFPWPASTGIGISCSPPLHIHPDIESTVAAKQTADHNSNGIQDVFQTTVLELQKPLTSQRWSLETSISTHRSLVHRESVCGLLCSSYRSNKISTISDQLH